MTALDMRMQNCCWDFLDNDKDMAYKTQGSKKHFECDVWAHLAEALL